MNVHTVNSVICICVAEAAERLYSSSTATVCDHACSFSVSASKGMLCVHALASSGLDAPEQCSRQRLMHWVSRCTGYILCMHVIVRSITLFLLPMHSATCVASREGDCLQMFASKAMEPMTAVHAYSYCCIS